MWKGEISDYILFFVVVIDQHLTLCTEQIVTSVAGSMEQREELGTLWRQLKNAKTNAADDLLIKGFEHTVDSTKFPLNQIS